MTQSEREALFDLLTLSIYSDHHISLTEEALLESAFIAEGWDSEYPKNLFLEKSFVRARAAAESDEEMADYIKDRARNLTNEHARIEALGVVKNILVRDGFNAEESRFMAMLQAAMPGKK